MQHVYNSLNNREAVFFAMSNAFDTVDHDLLASKLNNMGIKRSAKAWNKSYFSDRTPQVVMNGVKPATHKVERGTPQGTCISTILFKC